MLFKHWKLVPMELWRWPNFSPGEPNLACPHCGEFYLHFEGMDALQAIRNVMGSLRVNSGHRCAFWNVKVGGAPLSEHRKIAFDVHIGSYDRFELRDAAKNSGFKGLGYYFTFLHLDMGRKRFWYGGKKAEAIWNP